MKTTVIYHRADFDGLFCREIARKFLPPDTEFIGWDYGDPEPAKHLDGSQNLYILDLSVPSLMDYPKLIWIDHHKSAIGKFSKEISGDRIDGVAACRLAWQWFSQVKEGRPNKEDYVERRVAEPLAVRLAGEYDIWDKRDPRADTFQFGLRSIELTPLHWQELLNSNPTVNLLVDALLGNGELLQRYQNEQNASVIKDIGFTFQWEGLTFLACNHARYNSHLFTAALRPEHDACFGFKFTGHCAGGKPCEEWEISLYHAPGKERHDLSLIAVKHDGGGHRGACGFRTNKLPFLT